MKNFVSQFCDNENTINLISLWEFKITNPICMYMISTSEVMTKYRRKKLRSKILRDPKTGALLVIVLSCPQIGSTSSSTSNQRAAQNNHQALGSQDLYFLNFVTCMLALHVNKLGPYLGFFGLSNSVFLWCFIAGWFCLYLKLMQT